MAYALDDFVNKVRQILQDHPYEDRLQASYTAGSDTISVFNGEDWAEGDILEFYDTGDRYLIEAVSGDNLTVLTGFDGTTSANHDIDSRVMKDPTYPRYHIIDKGKSVLASLWPYVWKAETINVTPAVGSQVWYNLSTTMIDLVSVTQAVGLYVSFYGVEGGLPVLTRRNIPTGIVTSGHGILFPAGFYTPDEQVQIVGRAKVTPADDGTNFTDLDEDSIGVECVCYGTAEKLVADREIPRVTGSDVTLGDSTVEPMTKIRAASYYGAKFVELRNQWNAELMATLAPMKVWR